MSYKSLLFCPDEKTARLVTQVLIELDFAVDPANEPYVAVKKLNGQRFDAVVVDCQNEQDAALLFKTARDSSQNHSSLSVAVVEGQAGVAKAFRIGANLVLTKPINIEQSKGTLRVARGLLRKNETKAGLAADAAPARTTLGSSELSHTIGPASAALAPVLAVPSPLPDPSSAAPASSVPFSSLEVEPDPVTSPEAAEVAVLESLPDITGKPSTHAAATISQTEAQPIAAGTSGQAAAVAPALEKTETVGLKATGMPPMVTNQPIVVEKHFDEPFTPKPVAVPTFSSLSPATQNGGMTRFFKVAAVLAVVGGASFFGWQKFQPLQYLQRARAARTTSQPGANAPLTTAPAGNAAASASLPSAPESATEDVASSAKFAQESPKPSPVPQISAPPVHAENNDDGSIEVQELPMSRDSKSPASTPPTTSAKLPLIVKPDAGSKPVQPSKVAPPPPVQVSAAGSPDSVLPSLTTSNSPALPTLAPTSVRVSQGVSQGLILKKVAPKYPPMAVQMHKEGAVELLATISKQGSITNVKVLSGDDMLAKAAIDAVREWKYRPYLLNGEPVEIQTQITINFKVPN